MGESTRAGRGASQQRSRQRRELLLRAALGLLERDGPKAVTHRAVSEAAGLPPATAVYYFPAVADLTVAALTFHIEQRVAWLHELGTALAERAAGGPVSATELAVRLSARRDDLMIADFEAMLEAARNPAFRPAAIAARREVEHWLGTVLDQMGADDGRLAARWCLALLTGFGLQRLAFGNEEMPAGPVADALGAVIAYAIAGGGDRDRIRVSLRAPLPAPLQPTCHTAEGAAAAGRGASQQRSRERREQLLRATIGLFESGGSKAVTHRAASQAAGLPPATAGYYFTSIEDLLIGAAEFRVGERLGEIAALMETFRDTVGSPLELIERTAHALVHDGPATSITDVELFLEAARDRQFRSVAAAARRDVETVTAGYVSQLGVPDVASGTNALLAVTDGLALERLACGGDDAADEAVLVDALVALGHFYLTQDGSPATTPGS
jgi:DNA-binding transcriptional regulator YbjK